MLERDCHNILNSLYTWRGWRKKDSPKEWTERKWRGRRGEGVMPKKIWNKKIISKNKRILNKKVEELVEQKILSFQVSERRTRNKSDRKVIMHGKGFGCDNELWMFESVKHEEFLKWAVDVFKMWECVCLYSYVFDML